MKTSSLSKHKPQIAASFAGHVREGEILDCQANAASGLEIGCRVGSRPTIGIVRMIFLQVAQLTPSATHLVSEPITASRNLTTYCLRA